MATGNPKPDAGEDFTLPFSVVITPYRSLSRRGFLVFMAVFGAASFATGIAFLSRGAWPVLGFFGLDVALVWLMFKLNYRSARGAEWVDIDTGKVVVTSEDHRGKRQVDRFDAYWARLEREENENLGEVHLFLGERGRRVEIGKVLSAGEKLGLADAIDGALKHARQ